jgi:hypothetical protein
LINLEKEELKKKELLHDITAVHFDKAHTYTTVVIFGGYAAFFASWGFIGSYFSDYPKIYSILLMLLSVAIFVFWELYKMIMSGHLMMRYANCLTKTGDEFWEKLNEMIEFEKSHNIKNIRAWYIILFFSITLAVLSLLIFIYGVFEIKL